MAEDRFEDEEGFEEPEDEEQERRHNFLVLFFQFVYDETQDRIGQLTDALADGRLTTKEWASTFRKELSARHAEAWSIGRRLAGDMAPAGEEDGNGGGSAWERQEEFFQKFVKDLEEGRYTSEDGSLKERQVSARSRKYGDNIGATVHEAFKETMGRDRLKWVLGDKLHCLPKEGFAYNCPDLSEEPAKPADEWDTWPKSHKQPCWNNCGCHMSSEDGKYSTEGI